MPPVVSGGLVQPIDDVVVAYFDGEFTPTIEAACREVDRPYDCGAAIRQEHLAVQLQMFQLVNLDAEVIEDAKTADPFDEFVAFQRVWGPRHDLDLDAASFRSHQAFEDHRI